MLADRGARLLGLALGRNTSLRTVWLADNQISESAAHILATGVCNGGPASLTQAPQISLPRTESTPSSSKIQEVAETLSLFVTS
eukprot:SAG11_NODE_10066_length_859_cov_1.142105_2_plen_83_part_01